MSTKEELFDIQQQNGKLIMFCWNLVIYIVGLYPMVTTILSGRIFTKNQIDLEKISSLDVNPILKIINSIVPIIIFSLLILSILQLIKNNEKKVSKSVLFILITFILYKLSLIISAIVGGYYKVDKNVILSCCVILILFILSVTSKMNIINKFKNVFILYLYATLIATIISPSFSLQLGYQDGFFPIRLYGVTNHANALGSLISIYILLEIYYPKKTKFRLINLSLASIELLFTQSKTSWFIVGVFIIFSIIKHILKLSKKRDKYLFYSICIFIGTFLSIVLFQIVNNISFFITPDKLEQLKTITGRTYIWKYTMDIWKNNLIFGHGINVWSDPQLIDSFLKYYGWAPGTAHNLFIHTLGRAGLVGLVSLILYLITLIILIFRMKNNNDKYFLFLLWLIIILKSITEVPLTDSISDSGFIIEFIILGILITSVHKNIK